MRYLIPLAAAAIMLSGCSKKEAATAAPEEEELPLVETDVVAVREIPLSETYTANIEAENLNNIAPATPNRIRRILVDVGDPVRRGQTLVELDAANIDQLKIQLDQIERDYNRAAELLRIGSGTQMAVEQAKAQLDAARTQYQNARENTILTSPVSGVVTARNYDPGDMSGNLPILSVGQISPAVKAVINVTENDLTLVRRGMEAMVKFDAFPDEAFHGTVTRISPAIDPATRTFATEVTISNPKGEIKPGLFAYVTLDFGSRNNVVVPDRAVVKQTGSGNKFVYVYKGGKVSFNLVELGRRLDSGYEIISGVADGDSVVITGQSRLADGVSVTLKK
ncbi:MAG: efflux RND transporter periplasmic adaptor subunit [Muribaculaceae bacterium]|nr:efflux RND transporter periplasmic adaptor subunit [Muribaculaceae bacterium]MDE7032087.1 efflux RND transporter periplasmic adaptor subunit [Muribaculaceae bacterium]